jgi:hypothetical protein
LTAGFITGLVSFASANLLITDGFESGNFDAWTNTYGSPEIASDTKHTGSYAGFTNASGTNSCYYGAQSSPGWGNHLFARGYYKLDDFTADYCDRGLTYMSNWSAPADNMIVFAVLSHWEGSDCFWSFQVVNGSGRQKFDGPHFSLNTSRWYCVEIEVFVDDSAGYAKMYVDGALVLSVEGLDNDRYGNPNHVGFGSYYDNRGGEAVWWDDCVAADSYVGPEAPTSNSIMSDGFESGGFGSWLDTYGSPEVVSDVRHSGSYGAFVNASGTHTCYYGGYQSVGWGSHLFARGYYRFGPFLGDYGVRVATYVTNWGYGGVDQLIADVQLAHWTGDDYVWIVMTYDGVSQVSGDSSVFVLDSARWYCLELEVFVDGVGGYAGLFVDGVLVANVTGVTNDLFGDPNHVGFGQQADVRDGEAVWWDDCVVADAYIGPTPPTDLSVTVSPASVTLNEGQTQVFTASVSGGSGGESYQWFVDSVLQGGETSYTFTYTAVLGDSEVSVTVTDAASDTASDAASVTVNSPTTTPTPTPTNPTPSPTASPDSTLTPSPTTSPTQEPSPEPEPQTTDLPLEYLAVAAGILVALAGTVAFLLLKKKK